MTTTFPSSITPKWFEERVMDIRMRYEDREFFAGKASASRPAFGGELLRSVVAFADPIGGTDSSVNYEAVIVHASALPLPWSVSVNGQTEGVGETLAEAWERGFDEVKRLNPQSDLLD